MDLSRDLLTLLLLIQCSMIFVLQQEQIFFQLLALLLLLLHPQLLLLDLEVDFLLLVQASDGQMTTPAPCLQVSRDVLEEGVLGCGRLHAKMHFNLSLGWNVILAEDFVLAIRDRGDCKNQPVLVWKVLLLEADSWLYVKLLEILEQFLHQNEFIGRRGTDAEDDLSLVQAEDLAVLDQLQLLLRNVLARLLRQVLPVPGLQFPVGCDAFKGR